MKEATALGKLSVNSRQMKKHIYWLLELAAWERFIGSSLVALVNTVFIMHTCRW